MTRTDLVSLKVILFFHGLLYTAFCFNVFFYKYQVIRTWGVRNNIDFLSLSYTRHAEDIRHVRTS